ncbi:LON peptidase substrate-binding domain-containing protein [uncultured Rhodospira sp.]|uniref:LON peptidase substrate-binding domain-containing protein n=1 Tax=uncultured Rhodospira sp. TaxID=1936189 RepID=UPI00262F8722|nr:LON peptidase substrate-binding domain-containing protein [uncultured Rhodospira sp.]
MVRTFQPRFDELPDTVPVFPLTGALLLPGGRLPLNIFEPRYLSMVEDALAAGRLMAMVQPRGDEAETQEATPALYDVGCLGRIISFEETPDGRLLITLLGLNRCRLGEELPLTRGYRRVRADYAPYPRDLDDTAPVDINRDKLFAALKPFAAGHGLSFNWDIMREVETRPLITSLAMACPFEPREKQALLEAETPQARAELMLALLEMGAIGATAGGGARQ